MHAHNATCKCMAMRCACKLASVRYSLLGPCFDLKIDEAIADL